ncbi:hypothetical protein [Lentzea sp. NPDC060358]|uniref:hypothetical protein n=1 Tax=Lentzea sp. NPDC060358 TaxID=3347103 RepID=UPI00366516D2
MRLIDLDVTSLPGDRGPFGIDPLLRVLRTRLEHFGIPGVIDAIGTVTRLRELHQDTEITALLHVALRALFQCVTSNRQAVLLVDYSREVRLHLVVDACSRAGALAVVACGPEVEMSVRADELFVLVDDVIGTSRPPEADRA